MSAHKQRVEPGRAQNQADRTLAGLVSWVASHPGIDDVDEVAERVLNTLNELSDHDCTPVERAQVVEPLAGLLNRLIDTVGNCETEERNLKLLLWAEVVAQSETARARLAAE